jgi:hypothetical protein
MAARTSPAGEWCSPTREITSSRLSRLIDECRRREAVVEVVHDAPARQCPADALERLERARCNNMLIDLRSLADPEAPAIADEGAALDPGPAALLSEPEVEEATATLMYAPRTLNAMPPTAAPAQSLATGARRGRKRIARVRRLLCLGALVLLCLGGVVWLGLGPWA